MAAAMQNQAEGAPNYRVLRKTRFAGGDFAAGTVIPAAKLAHLDLAHMDALISSRIIEPIIGDSAEAQRYTILEARVTRLEAQIDRVLKGVEAGHPPLTKLKE